MMTPARKEALELLGELSAAWPDMRLGQLLTSLATAARGPQVESIWDLEDEELIRVARRQLDRLTDSQTPSA
jgi:hypothetical protein